MDIHPQILTFGGSLIAIFALAGLAVLLRLGGSPRLENTDDAQREAGEVVDGYEPVQSVLDTDGTGALMVDDAGAIMLIKRHGNRFAGRILTENASAEASAKTITIASGEARFGSVTLSISDAAPWAEAINGLSGKRNA